MSSSMLSSAKSPQAQPGTQDSSRVTDNGTLIYHQTIIPTQNITHVVQGSFSLPNSQDLVIIRHTTLELWTLRAERGNMECLHSVPLFANVYAAVAVPTNAMYGSAGGSLSSPNGGLRSKHERGVLSDQTSSILGDQSSMMHGAGGGAQRDLVHYLAITSESGYLTLLRYELAEPPIPARLPTAGVEAKNGGSDEGTGLYITTSLRGKFIKVSEHCLGRSGARLTVPGARMAVDSRGEALFITALMRNKIVVPLKRTNTKLSATAQQLRGSGGDESFDAAERDANDDMTGFDPSSEGNRNDDGVSRKFLTTEEGKKAVKRREEAPKGVIAFGNPIETHRNTVIHSVCALEGFMDENAVFAALEQEIVEDVEQQQEQDDGKKGPDASITSGGAFLKLPSVAGGEAGTVCRKFLLVYAYVPSLRQVQRLHLVNLPATAHRLVSVPSAPCGPGGVLVCTDVDLIWYDLLSSSLENSGLSSPAGNPNLGVGGVFKCIYPMPRRFTFTETLYDPSIIQHAVATVANDYFLLLQDEQGDLFRVLLSTTEVRRAHDALRLATAAAEATTGARPSPAPVPAPAVPNPLAVHYFDTIAPASALGLFRRGYLFAAAEAGAAHHLFKITRDGYTSEADAALAESGPAHETGPQAEADPTATAGGEDGRGGGGGGGAAAPQRQVQLTGVAGRGAASVLFVARYGHTARREGRFGLPASFQGIAALPSAAALQRRAQAQRGFLAQVSALLGRPGHTGGGSRPSRRQGSSRGSGEDGGHESRRRVKAVKQLLALMQEQQQVLGGTGAASVEMDKVVLTTAQGTTVFHVGRTVELDNWTGFVTVERTLAATTLPWGQGYVQVTPRGIYVHPVSCISSHPGNFEAASKESAAQQQPLGNVNVIEPSNWTDPHGKLLLAAATTSSTILVSFMKGGIASFKVDIDFTASAFPLKQCDTLPTFPTAQAISLLQIPQSSGTSTNRSVLSLLLNATASSTVAAAASASLTDSALQSMLAQTASTLEGNAGSGGRELAAVATIAQEVYILDPSRLRDPLEKINCRRQKIDGGAERGSSDAEGGIVSVLLTFLGGGSRQLSLARRLFCLIGHMDGTLTRCELDPVTAKLIERVELSCGSAPCQTIAGDGDTLCYIQSGQDCWCCEMWDGVVKTVPWRFPSRQTAFVPFVLPQKQHRQLKKEEVKKEAHQDDETGSSIVKDEEGNQFMLIDGNDGNGAGLSGGEHVIAVRNRELSLFLAQKTGNTGIRSLEYSMSTHSLPLEGRRILQHPMRPSYFIIASTEHRSHGMRAVERSRHEIATTATATAAGGGSGAGHAGTGIPLDAPQRAFGPRDHYNSSLQLFVKDTNHVFPPYYLPEGDGIASVAIGSFQADFGREPVVVVGAASQYSHGAGCGRPPSWTQGWLRAFRFTSYATAPAGAAAPQQRTVMMDSEGNPILRLEPLHNTLIRTTPATGLGPEGGPNVQGANSSGTLGAPDYPSAVHICEDVGLLFVGLGPQNGLRIYVWGQQQFLRKRQLPNFPSRIVAIETMFFTPFSSRGVSSGDGADKNALQKYYLADLYHCPFDRPEARRRAMEKQLLVVCATMSHSVIVAALQPGSTADSSCGSAGTPSFLLVIAQDAVPRSITALAVLRDEHTIAVADRFGYVTLLRISDNTRTKFSVPIEQMSDAELSAVNRYISNEQDLEEVACHYTGELVTAMQVQPYNPSQGVDPSLAIHILFYATAMGRVGAYVPFVSEEDAAMAAYVQPVLISHLRALLAPGSGSLPYNHRSSAPRMVAMMANPTHHVIDGDLMALYRQSSSLMSETSVFTTEAKSAIEEEVETIRRMEAARRKVLGLPPRELPLVTNLVAKQRALVTLPE